MPILCAQNSTAARNESHPPITQRWEHFLAAPSDSETAIEKVKTRLSCSKNCARTLSFANLRGAWKGTADCASNGSLAS
jgi:hypothetical protein